MLPQTYDRVPAVKEPDQPARRDSQGIEVGDDLVVHFGFPDSRRQQSDSGNWKEEALIKTNSVEK